MPATKMDDRERHSAGYSSGTVPVTPPGLEAIYSACRRLYPDQPNPLQVTALVKFWLGGPDPLDYISMYANPGDPDRNIPPHWHYISFGLTDLHGDCRLYELGCSDGPSGFGFELTFRLKRELGEANPPTWPAALMQALARYVFQSENVLCSGDHVSWHTPLDGSESRIQHMLMTEDAQLQPTSSVLGVVNFIQIVGVCGEELKAAQHWNGPGIIELLRSKPCAGGPWLVTDMRRGETIFELDPHLKERVDQGIEQEGSNLSGVSAWCSWDEPGDNDNRSSDSEEDKENRRDGEEEEEERMRERRGSNEADRRPISDYESEQIKATLKKGLSSAHVHVKDESQTQSRKESFDSTVSSEVPIELIRTRSLESVHLKFNLEAGSLLPLALRGRLKHGRHFTFKGIMNDIAITLVSSSVVGSITDEEHPFAAHGTWLQQWSDLCKARDMDQVKLAEQVLMTGVTQRLDVLREFYTHKYPELSGVLTQLFTVPASGPSEKTQQEQRQATVSSSSNSSHAKSTCIAVQSPVTTSRHHPTATKGRQRRGKQAEASLLFDINTLVSQESITAHSLENPDVPSDEEYGKFLPSPVRKKSWIEARVSPGKSQHTTRLRQRVRETVADRSDKRTYHATLSMGTTNFQTYQDETASYFDTNLGIGIDKDRMMTESTTERTKNLESGEDIPALLHEMGCKTSEQKEENWKNKQIQQPDNRKKSGAAEIFRDQPERLLTTVAIADSAIATASKVSSEKLSISETGRQNQGSSRRKYGDILDDIFSSSPPDSDNEPSPNKRKKVCDKKMLNKNESVYSIQPVSSITIKGTGSPQPHPQRLVNTETEDKDSNPETVANKDKNIDILEHESSDLFDDFLRTSTLKDEGIDCFSRSDRKKKRVEKGRTSVSDVGERCREKDAEAQAGDGEDDHDALDMFRFDLSKYSNPQTGSQSLFS